jgi:hypothetical protein
LCGKRNASRGQCRQIFTYKIIRHNRFQYVLTTMSEERRVTMQLISTASVAEKNSGVNSLSATFGQILMTTLPIRFSIGTVYELLWKPLFSLLFMYLPGAQS